MVKRVWKVREDLLAVEYQDRLVLGPTGQLDKYGNKAPGVMCCNIGACGQIRGYDWLKRFAKA